MYKYLSIKDKQDCSEATNLTDIQILNFEVADHAIFVKKLKF